MKSKLGSSRETKYEQKTFTERVNKAKLTKGRMGIKIFNWYDYEWLQHKHLPSTRHTRRKEPFGFFYSPLCARNGYCFVRWFRLAYNGFVSILFFLCVIINCNVKVLRVITNSLFKLIIKLWIYYRYAISSNLLENNYTNNLILIN